MSDNAGNKFENSQQNIANHAHNGDFDGNLFRVVAIRHQLHPLNSIYVLFYVMQSASVPLQRPAENFLMKKSAEQLIDCPAE